MRMLNRFNVKTPGLVLGLALAAVLTLVVLPACTAQTDGQEGHAAGVLATVGDTAITESQLEERAGEQLEQAKMQKLQCEINADRTRHQVMEQALQAMVRDQILEAEADARGVTKDELMESEVTAKAGEVTDEDVDTFYQQNQARIQQPKEQIAPQIKDYLQQQRNSEIYTAFIDGLEKKYDVDYNLGPFRITVAAEGPSKGPDSAPIKIVEFSDFECPFCSRVNPTIQQVIDKYGDKVQIVFRQFPLSIHPAAQKAAEASLCANDQGKFWEMHDAMFADQRNLGVDNLRTMAESLELDMGTFNQCLDSDKYYETVQDDMRDGVMAGVSGTPALFVNGRFLNGAVPFDQIAEIIDEELEAGS